MQHLFCFLYDLQSVGVDPLCNSISFLEDWNEESETEVVEMFAS
jgi:hypothetical protein